MNAEKEKIKKIVSQVGGWLTDGEGELLYDLAKKCQNKGAIVEVGSWKGKSTIWLGKGSRVGNNVKIYAIDPHTGDRGHRHRYGKVWTYEEFKKNIRKAKIDDLVIPIIKTSEEAVKEINEPVELIFIDGSHKYEDVKLDFELWFPKVINKGIMAFHDSDGRYGPTKVVKGSVYKSKHFIDIKRVDSITYAKKVAKNKFKDRLRNRCLLFIKNIRLLPHTLPKYIKAKKRKLIGK